MKARLPVLFALFGSSILAANTPLIFPEPRELATTKDRFLLDERVRVVIPVNPSARDSSLARLLVAELSDRYGLPLRTERLSRLPIDKPFILLGTATNPLVQSYCATHGISISQRNPGPEGYVLDVTKHAVVVAGSDDRGAFYGVQSLRQLARSTRQGLEIPGLRVSDWPYKSFRGVKLYLPGRNNIPFFKGFVRDFMALYKFNRLILEVNAGMRLDRHPELNTGWVAFARDLKYTRRNDPTGPNELVLNSSHYDTADGGILDKAEVGDLVAWARQNEVEVIPEIPSLSHSYYLLTRHRELSEIPDEEWPDTYCPSNPQSYRLLFDVFDEYIEVTKPKTVHVGHDEWRMPIDLCPRCKGKNTGELFAADLRKIHDYLSQKGIRTAIWGDYLMQSVRGKGPQDRVTRGGWAYRSPGALTPAQVRDLVPKDILIFNWFWGGGEGSAKLARSEAAETQLAEWGFEQIYGNFRPTLEDYGKRSRLSSIIGGAPSSWAATTEFNFGKDMLYDLLGCSSLLWSTRLPTEVLSETVQSLMPGAHRRLNGEPVPSDDADPVAPVDISRHFNSDFSGMKTGRLTDGRKVFDLAPGAVVVATAGKEKSSSPREVSGIAIGEDATSLIFLHACAKPAANEEAYRLIWNSEDSADLLGWYEVVYEDGFVQTIPIRYGVNILEWEHSGSKTYAYLADAVACAREAESRVTFYVFEWTNPRLGKIIKEVRLKGTFGFRGANTKVENAYGPVIAENAVILKAISLVRKRTFPEPVKAQSYEGR